MENGISEEHSIRIFLKYLIFSYRSIWSITKAGQTYSRGRL